MSADTLAPAVRTEKAVRLNPTFFGALRGVWLFTWRSQVAWPRLAASLLGLFALPVLVYLTTPSPQAWAESHRLRMGNPAASLGSYNRRLVRLGVPLEPAQQADLARIVAEEYRRAESEWAERSTADASPESQREMSEQCQERILSRVKPLLNDRQFNEFRTHQRRNRPQQPQAAGEPVWGRTGPFYHCLIDLYFFIILPLHCVRMCGALIRDELEANTLSFLTTRPLSRARLLIVKYLAQVTWIQVWLVVQTLVLLAAGSFRSIPELRTLAPLLLGAQVLAVFAWSALGLLLGQISKRYMALALLYGFIVEMGIGRIPTNINSLSLMRHLQRLLGHNPALQNLFQWPAAEASGPVSALVLAASIFLILAALLFTFKEYHHTVEMQK